MKRLFTQLFAVILAAILLSSCGVSRVRKLENEFAKETILKSAPDAIAVESRVAMYYCPNPQSTFSGYKIIKSQEEFNKYFRPEVNAESLVTAIDFNKEFVVAIMLPHNYKNIEIYPLTSYLSNGQQKLYVSFSYYVGKLGKTLVKPILLLVYDKQYANYTIGFSWGNTSVRYGKKTIGGNIETNDKELNADGKLNF